MKRAIVMLPLIALSFALALPAQELAQDNPPTFKESKKKPKKQKNPKKPKKKKGAGQTDGAGSTSQ